MEQGYKKHILDLEVLYSGYKLWKDEAIYAYSRIEKYKEKGTIYFTVRNLLPSTVLGFSYNREYRMVFMGSSEGEVSFVDFGPVYFNKTGECRKYQKFNCKNFDGKGTPFEDFSFCLIVAASKEGSPEQPMVLIKAELPFAKNYVSGFDDEWKEQIELCQGKEAMDLFAEEIDETGAKWYRFELEKSCPKHLDTFRVLIDRYQHYVLGVNNDQYFIGIPGRFILEEQPDQGSSGFKLWQPLKGAEKLYTYIEDLSDEEKHDIFGYWIAGIDKINGDFFPV